MASHLRWLFTIHNKNEQHRQQLDNLINVWLLHSNVKHYVHVRHASIFDKRIEQEKKQIKLTL